MAQTLKRSQINSENIKQLVYTQGEAVHYIIGTDPDKEKVPYFELESLNKIDTTAYDYYLQVNSSVYYSDLVLKEVSQTHVQANYKLYLKVLDSEGNTVDKEFREQKANIQKRFKDDVAFNQSRLIFEFKLPAGDYEVHATLVDVNSNKQFQINQEFTRRAIEKNRLISDIEFIDSFTNQRVISTTNNINNRKKDLLMIFDTYQKDLGQKHTYGLEIFKKKTTAEAIADGILDVLKFISFQSVADDTTFESIFYQGFEKKATQKFNRHMAIVDKSLFDDIEFSKALNVKTKLVAKVMSTFHTVKDAKSEDFDLDAVTIDADSANAEKIDYRNRVLVGGGTETLALETSEYETEFMFEWEFSPQTPDEMSYALSQLTYILDQDSIDHYRNQAFEDQENFFNNFWAKYAVEKEEGHPYYAMKQYFRKIDFCAKNFPDLISLNEGSFQGSRQKLNNNGWASDKAKTYMRFGSPDEIHGNNIFNKYGEMVQYDQTPPVQLWYYKKTGKKFYFRDNMLITSN